MNNRSPFGSLFRHQVGEYLDGFVVIGFEHKDGTPVVVADIPDPKTALAVNNILSQLLVNGGVGVVSNENPQD